MNWHTLECARQRWENEKPKYEQLAKRIRDDLESCTATAGIQAHISYRIKETASLLKKLWVKQKSYEELSDKAGVRVVVLFLQDLHQVCDLIREAPWWEVVKEEPFGIVYNEIGYRAIHFDVRHCAFPELLCEIQARTVYQDAWAQASHFLQYKKDEHIPHDILRRIYRLSAVLEVADVEFDMIKKDIDKLPDTQPLSVLGELEHHYLQMVGTPYNRELSLEVINALMPLLSQLKDLKGFIHTFVQNYGARLRGIYQKYLEAKGLPRLLLFQPESILIFACFQYDSHQLFSLWSQRFPSEPLVELADIWGIRAPHSAEYPY